MASEGDVELGQASQLHLLDSVHQPSGDAELIGQTGLPHHLHSITPTSSDDMNHVTRPEYSDYQVNLYKAALRGDWETASRIHKDHQGCFTEEISKNSDTVLHVAAAGGRTNFVKQLLRNVQFTAADLERRNKTGNTAFCLAAASGALEILQEMEKVYPRLSNISGSCGISPTVMAALLGHREVVTHLLPCLDDLSKEQRADVLISSINTDLYDVALKILDKDESLAIAWNKDGYSALYVLAQKTHKKSASQLNPWRQSCNTLFSKLWGEKQGECCKLELVRRLWGIVIKQSPSKISDILSSPQPRLLFVAIEMGNYEFVVTLMRQYPDLIWEIDNEKQTIFHAAVKYRQEKIFGHIFQLEGINYLLTAYKNPNNGNSILHLAATLPPLERLNVVSGAALQMQRELLWFQVVEEVVRREYADLKNYPNSSKGGNETPRALFRREHEKLREQGEKWMRETAGSCMLVATLVAGVVFQAALQPPKSEKLLVSWMFVISDVSSLLASTASILTFLAILTSRYAEEDFLMSLPLKLMVGLGLLFFAIMTMLITFTVTIAIFFPHPFVWIAIAILAWFTGIFYIWQHFPLLVDVQFGSDKLFRPEEELFRDR